MFRENKGSIESLQGNNHPSDNTSLFDWFDVVSPETSEGRPRRRLTALTPGCKRRRGAGREAEKGGPATSRGPIGLSKEEAGSYARDSLVAAAMMERVLHGSSPADS